MFEEQEESAANASSVTWRAGHRTGYEEGYNNGYTDGYSKGYSAGYRKAMDKQYDVGIKDYAERESKFGYPQCRG